MKRALTLAVAGLYWVMAASLAQGSGAGLRIACSGDAEGASVKINGVFKGECPIDVEVRAGLVNIEVSKVSGDFQRGFQKSLTMADGTVKRVEVELGAQVLTAQGMEREAARTRLRTEQAQREADARRQLELEQERRADEVEAMVATGDRLVNGSADASDQAEALSWYQRAAQAGSELGAYKANVLEKRGGKPYSFDQLARQIFSKGKPDLRKVNISEREAARQFVLNDAFFSTPAPSAPEKINFTYTRFGVKVKHVCTVSDGQTWCDLIAPEGTSQSRARLGGLATVDLSPAGSGGMRAYPLAYTEVYGSPFPVVTGAPFGFDSKFVANGTLYATATRCAWRREKNRAGNDVLECLNIVNATTYYSSVYVWRPDLGLFLYVDMVRD